MDTDPDTSLTRRLNIFYITLDKIQTFASGKYELVANPADAISTYESKQSDARDTIDNLTINKRMVSTARLIQTSRQNSGLSPTASHPSGSLARAPSSASTVTPRPALGTATSSFKKAPPPPPPSAAAVAAPPPYTPGSAPAAAATKRPPPPIPASKPKPKEYVVALYDFAAQVRRLSSLLSLELSF